jgi:hypothetical protein
MCWHAADLARAFARSAETEMSAAEKIETEMAILHVRTRRQETSYSYLPELMAERRGW